MAVTRCTLVYLLRDGTVCLGFKKRGFGAGNWNGFGGKVRVGEDVRESACRELFEESGVRVDPGYLEAAGELTFSFTEHPGACIDVHVFRVITFNGEPIETEEMRPQWFDVRAVPYDTMWPDDAVWMPAFFAGEYVQGHFQFAGATMGDYTFESTRNVA